MPEPGETPSQELSEKMMEVFTPLRETDVKEPHEVVKMREQMESLRGQLANRAYGQIKAGTPNLPQGLMEAIQPTIVVKFKKLHQDAVTPSYSKAGDGGCDLTAVGMLETDKYIEYDTGIAVAIPEGYVGLLFPRSSVSNKDLILANCTGVVDSGYRGSIKCRFKVIRDHSRREDLKDPVYRIGDRVAQLMIIPFPRVTYCETQELDDTERGTDGLGSTGA